MGEALIVRRGAKELGPLVIEAGLIVEFFGFSSNTPDGWQLCDGTNDTPNLIDKFILGAGDTYNVGDTGGSANGIVPSHTHSSTVTNTVGNHQHTTRVFKQGTVSLIGDRGSGGQLVNLTSTAGGSHSHSITFTNSGENAVNKNLPPYYSLFYIIKLEEA